MSSTKSQVAVATSIPNLTSGQQQQQQKDYNTEESLGRQNSFGLNRRGNMKGKHLTRSHAMREATSPPRTPTPRTSESSSQVSPNGYQQQQQQHQQHQDINEGNNNNNNGNNKLHTQSSATRGNSPIIDTPTVIVTSQHKQQQQQPQQSNVALCNETEFPKLSPPKSKSGSNSSGGGGGSGSGNSSSHSGVNINCNNNSNQQQPQRINNNTSDGHNNTNNNNNNSNSNNNNINNSSNKKTNGDTAGVNETHNKGTNNGNINAGNANKNYNNQSQSQQQQFNAGNALQKALNVTDNNQPTPIYNSPMNYQLHTNDVNREHQQQTQQQQQSYIVYEKENRCPRNDSQNSMNSNDEMHYEAQQQQQQHQQQQQQQHQQHQSQQHQRSGGGGKKHRTNSNSKGSKPRLKNMGSTNSGGGGSASNMGAGGGVAAGGMASSSIDGSLNSSNNTSGFISRENSNEQYTDYGGTDLLSFFKETLNKNVKDRQFLLKVEKDLIEFVQEGNRGEIRFPQASSYNRMLIHRTAAFFGMEHNVDTETQQCVIVAPTKNTRIPDIRFKTLVINNRDDSRKSILKRDTHSFDEARQSSYLCPDRGGMLDRKAKSFEEREEDYDRARSRIFNRSQNESCPGGGGSTDDDNNYISWTSSVDQQQFSRGRSGKVLKIQNSPDGRSGSVVQKSNNNFGNYGASNQSGAPLIRGDSTSSNKSMGTGGGGNGTRIFSKQDSAGSSNTSWRLSPSSSGTVYHYDPSNMPPAQAMTNCANVTSSGANIFHTNQNNSPQQQQQHPVHNSIKKQHKSHQQFNKLESTSSGTTHSTGESVSESSTQTINVGEEGISSNNMLDASYQEEDICNQEENEECDNSANGCLSITTTTSTKNYDRIEVQKFKNQATSPNIPINEKEDIVKREHSSHSPISATPTHQNLSQTPQQSQTQMQNRETPHSSRSTPFSNSDTLTKRSSEEPRATSWTQSYQAPDGSTVFHTTTTPSNSTNNPYCTTTYQQGPDGSIYAVPQGMIYAYPPAVDGEFQGYFMPVFDPSQQRNDTTGILQPGTQAIYSAGGATTMVPVAAYPTAQFATTNGAPIYPSQVIYSGEQFQSAGTPLTATAPASATAQLQQIPMTTYPIGYPYPYNGYWGQTMTYYVPQQAVPATSLLAAPAPPAAPGNVSHVAGGVNSTGPNGSNSTAGPSTNSSNTTNNSSGHGGNGNVPNLNHQNGTVTTGYQSHIHSIGGTGSGVGSSHSGGTTYYGTGRIKRPNSHFGSAGSNGGHQVLATAAIPNGVTTATYQLGHAVPTLTLAATAPPQSTAGAPTATDLSGGGAPTTTTMYALPQHAAIFPANMFPYATNATATAIGPQSGTNIAPQTAIIQPPGNPQTHVATGVAGQANAATGAIHNPHHTNTVITPFYTTTHHHAPHPGMQSAGGHAIHAPGPSAIPIVDPATITNVTPLGPVNNSVYSARGGGGNTVGTSQSAPSTPLSMPSSSNIHHSQRNPTVFSTPPILNNNGGNYNSSNSTPQYYGNTEVSHQTSANTGGGNNSPHNNYVSSTYEKRNNTNSGGGKKPLSYQSASLSRQNSTSGGGGYNGNSKTSGLVNNANNNNNDTRASPSSSTNSRPHSIKRGGGGVGNAAGVNNNDKQQNPLLSGPPSFVGSANIQNINNNSYQAVPNADIGAGNIPIVNVSKPPIRLNASAAAFRQKGTSGTGNSSAVEYRRNTGSQRNSPATNASSSNDNSNNNSPNSIQNSSNAATPIAAGCYAPSYMITAQNNGGESAPAHPPPPSLYITTAPARGPAHIPPHLQTAAANGAAVPAAAAAATATVPQQAATAVLGGAAAAAAAADVANAAAVAAAAATVAHHHHHQPLLGTYNPGTSGLYFKYGHTYFAHPSVALPNSRRSPSTDLRPPIAQMAGMYPTVNMMIPAQPRHPGRHPNPNYKGSRPR